MLASRTLAVGAEQNETDAEEHNAEQAAERKPDPRKIIAEKSRTPGDMPQSVFRSIAMGPVATIADIP